MHVMRIMQLVHSFSSDLRCFAGGGRQQGLRRPTPPDGSQICGSQTMKHDNMKRDAVLICNAAELLSLPGVLPRFPR